MLRAHRSAIVAAKRVHRLEDRRISWLCEPFYKDLKAFWDDTKNKRRSDQASINRKKNHKGTYSGDSRSMAETHFVRAQELGVSVEHISFLDNFIETHMTVLEDGTRRWVHP